MRRPGRLTRRCATGGSAVAGLLLCLAGAAPAATVHVELALLSSEGATSSWPQQDIRAIADPGERLSLTVTAADDAIVLRASGTLGLTSTAAAARRCVALGASVVSCAPARATDPDVQALNGGGPVSKPARTVLALAGGGGADVITVASQAPGVEVHIAGGAGTDRLSHHGPVATLAPAVLSGGAGDDHLVGGDGPETLSGDDGRDLLAGAGGDDRLGGGAGADRLLAGAGADELAGGGVSEDGRTLTIPRSTSLSPDVLDGGSGVDLASFGRGARTARIDLGRGRGGVGGGESRLVGVEGVSASAPVVTLVGDGRANVLATEVSATTRAIALRGRGGRDTLELRALQSPRLLSAAHLDGGAGSDACGSSSPLFRLRVTRHSCERRWPIP